MTEARGERQASQTSTVEAAEARRGRHTRLPLLEVSPLSVERERERERSREECECGAEGGSIVSLFASSDSHRKAGRAAEVQDDKEGRLSISTCGQTPWLSTRPQGRKAIAREEGVTVSSI